jgi:[ribosomal protein S18]-alanine N-acetyltransferase
MTIREYKLKDKEKCLKVFKSNCPKYFDKSELPLFNKWLDHQVCGNPIYQSPTYTASELDAYYVIEIPESGIIGCGGFYIVKGQNEARFAWGMIHAKFHRQGFGTELYNYRKDIIKRDWPNHILTLGTSQHTYSFYEKMGMTVTETFISGYGKDLDRYDMKLIATNNV